jgi:hypothetical protein
MITASASCFEVPGKQIFGKFNDIMTGSFHSLYNSSFIITLHPALYKVSSDKASLNKLTNQEE